MTLALSNPRIMRYRPPPTAPTFTGRLGPAFYTDKTLPYVQIGIGSPGTAESQRAQYFIPGSYVNAVPHRMEIYINGSSSRSGTGANDNNNTSQMSDALGDYVAANSATYPTIVCFLQLPGTVSHGGFAFARAAYGLILSAITVANAEWNIDLDRVYLCGASQGAIVIAGGLMYAPIRAAIAALYLGAGALLWQYAALFDAALTTDAAACAAAAALCDNLPLWQCNSEPGDSTISTAYQPMQTAWQARPGFAGWYSFTNRTPDSHTACYNNTFADVALRTAVYTKHR